MELERESMAEMPDAIDMVTAAVNERLPKEVLTALMVGGWAPYILWRHKDHVPAFSSSAALYELDKEMARRFLSPELFAEAELPAEPNGKEDDHGR